MGLDIVELVIRVEEKFAISLPDGELQSMQTVGDLYRLVLSKLNIAYEPVPISEDVLLGRRFLRPQTAVEVWRTLKAVIVDQLKVDKADVVESASFLNDLGAD